MNLILITIMSTILASYKEELGYRWPEDEFVEVKTLFFGTYEDMSFLVKGERECFTLEEVAPVEVCGTVTGVARWVDSWWVKVEVE